MSRSGRFNRNPNFLKGATWDQDPNQKVETNPSELFPSVPDLPPPRPLTRAERRIIENGKALRKAIHQGPLYTESKKADPFQSKRIYGEQQRNAQYSANARKKADPFESGVPTYSAKYSRPKRTIPQLNGRPFNKELFPLELHDAIDGKSYSTINRPSNKKLVLSMTPAEQKAEAFRKLQELDQKIGHDEEEGEKPVEDEDVAGEEEEQDDNFDDDDFEMEGDYDAEQYFDDGDGEDDVDDGDGGGNDYS